jgi:3-isopropylmalate/(R)-2-methylmalate dehydratase small subunit
MTDPFQVIKGRAIPLDRADVDTDQIIPARHLKRIERTGFGQYAFEIWRNDPEFVLNDERYKDAPILVTGPNFGCGSSREHAPWALWDLGLKVIIAPSFADIFRNNCASIGLLAVQLPQAQCDRLMTLATTDWKRELIVNLEAQTIVSDGREIQMEFEVDPFVKYRLLNGLDLIAASLEQADKIEAFEAKRPAYMPHFE